MTRLSPTPPAMDDSESLWPHDSELLLGPVLPEFPDEAVADAADLEAEPDPEAPDPAPEPDPDPVALDVSLPPLSLLPSSSLLLPLLADSCWAVCLSVWLAASLADVPGAGAEPSSPAAPAAPTAPPPPPAAVASLTDMSDSVCVTTVLVAILEKEIMSSSI